MGRGTKGRADLRQSPIFIHREAEYVGEILVWQPPGLPIARHEDQTEFPLAVGKYKLHVLHGVIKAR